MSRTNNALIQGIYYFLILFISYTWMNKAMAIGSFQVNLLKTGLYSDEATVYISYAVLGGELAALLLLLFAPKKGSLMLLIMLVVFTLYICFLYLTGRYEVCGCGGILNGLAFRYHLLINLTLVLLASLLVRHHYKTIQHEV